MAGGHYSYAHYADPATADTFDAQRFGGPIGSLLAETQERVLLSFLGDVAGRDLLDVGTGTGRAAMALARRGAHVTGIDASSEMLRVARQRSDAEGFSIEWRTGDAHALALPDRSFDAAISFRVLMHAPDWRRCLGELCRVSRSHVVFDFPATFSAAALQSLSRRARHRFGARVEAYRVLTRGAVDRELRARGFIIRAEHRQFVLPIALHKRLGSIAATTRVERILDRAGLLRRFGSPVTLVAERCAY